MKEEQMEGGKTPESNNSEQVMENEQTVDKTDATAEGALNKEQDTATEENSDTDERTSAIEKLNSELSEVKDKHLRLYSEFENFRRRTARERLDLISSANADLIEALLPVLDDFERAIEAADQSDSNAENQGIHLIYQKLVKELKSKGLKPMEGLEGEPFDAEKHEAISQTPASKKKLVNRIVHVVEKGYYLNDKVLRYAKVVIGT